MLIAGEPSDLNFTSTQPCAAAQRLLRRLNVRCPNTGWRVSPEHIPALFGSYSIGINHGDRAFLRAREIWRDLCTSSSTRNVYPPGEPTHTHRRPGLPAHAHAPYRTHIPSTFKPQDLPSAHPIVSLRARCHLGRRINIAWRLPDGADRDGKGLYGRPLRPSISSRPGAFRKVSRAVHRHLSVERGRCDRAIRVLLLCPRGADLDGLGGIASSQDSEGPMIPPG